MLLSNPNRLLIEITGPTGENVVAERYAVENPMVSQVQVGSDAGKIRLTLMLKGDQPPVYSVDDLNDTVVAFLGEPKRHRSARARVDRLHPARRARRRAAPAPVAAARGVAAPPPPRSITAPPPPGCRSRRRPWCRLNTDAGSSPRGKRLYYGQPISLDFKDADVHNVLRLLADVSRLNIVATDDVQGKSRCTSTTCPGIRRSTSCCRRTNLESVQEGNVVRISTVKRLREEREELQKAPATPRRPSSRCRSSTSGSTTPRPRSSPS